MPFSEIERSRYKNASSWPNAAAGAGSVGSSAGTYTACTEVMAPLLVEAIRSCNCAHLGGQRGLITHGRRHAAQQGRHFAAGLREAEDVVDEQQRVGAGRVAEIFGHGQGRQRHPQTGAGRLVHLAEHHAGLLDDAAAGVADLGFLHFQPQVGSFAGSLADAGEHRVTAVGTGDAGDQLGENDRLAQAGTAEQTGLAAADERREQVDDLDAGLEQLGLGRQVGQRRARRDGSASALRP